MKICFYSSYITQCHYDSNISCLQTVRGGRHLEFDRITELAWNPEVITEIAVETQDKFQPVIQGT